jgi:hypothetical protein
MADDPILGNLELLDREIVEGTSQLEGTPTGLLVPAPLAVNPLHRVLVPIEQGVGPNPSTPLAFLLRTTDGQNYVRDAGTNVIRHLEAQTVKGKSGRRINRQLKAEQRRAEARKVPCQICQGSGISAIESGVDAKPLPCSGCHGAGRVNPGSQP